MGGGGSFSQVPWPGLRTTKPVASSPDPIIYVCVCGREGYYLFLRQCFPIFPDPTRDITVGKYKAGLHEA